MKKQPSLMILILFILLLLALLPLIYQQIYAAATHDHMPIHLNSPREPTHNQVMSCSSAFLMTSISERRSFSGYAVQDGPGAHRTVIVVRTNFSARFYTSPPAF